MVRNLAVTLALLASLALAGCSGGSTGGAMPPVQAAPQSAQTAQTQAVHVAHHQDGGGGIGDFPGDFASAVFSRFVPLTSTPADCGC